ncbi:MAG: inositol monophosphatase family protein, partial [Promethearchaeota archaeon]
GIKRIGSNPEGFLIMDPIDGSSNLSHDIPFACLAIAYATEVVFEAVEVAVVLDLFSGKCYYATKGGGAFRNQVRIHPSDANPLGDSLVGIDTEIPPISLMKGLEEIDEGRIKYTRHLGANAMELCFVADGRLDGFIDLRGVFRGTDLAAASLILQESGAVLVDPKGVQIKGKCSNDARYTYIAARDNIFAKRLLALVSGKKK